MLLAVAAQAQSSSSGTSASSAFCDRTQQLTAGQQDRSLQFAAVVRAELNALGDSSALISRSGLDLSRFQLRYSHAAVSWRDDQGAWSARQLYYACSEEGPRIYDQGIPGFVTGIDDTSLAYVSIVSLPASEANSLRRAVLDTPVVQHLLAVNYSANAYPFSTRYQNCNQWVMEMLAVAWGGLADADDLRTQAQHWLQEANYAPEPVDVGSHAVMFASMFVPLVHLGDHPEEDRRAMKLKVSLPSTVEAFVRQRVPDSERIEVCHDERQIVVHRGWTPVADGCKPGEGDRVLAFD
ncbi:hypothetical protein GCM10011396_06650 [Undibacterium terreum]|uniref:DUF2145 domain-containing protein n=1 Tax=Undibacterium terreum TaxID=1224302 RepID=A0A916U6P6_9BURK|nr:DUF2145 domain-containing protein [Undibacterium terreum]GGC62419.1 hypothetical protein GCM10011396_06650 [Undibacterium terreum]